LHRIGPLTLYLTQTIVEDPLAAGQGTTVLRDVRWQRVSQLNHCTENGLDPNTSRVVRGSSMGARTLKTLGLVVAAPTGATAFSGIFPVGDRGQPRVHLHPLLEELSGQPGHLEQLGPTGIHEWEEVEVGVALRSLKVCRRSCQ
jgi:hypothetical protein